MKFYCPKPYCLFSCFNLILAVIFLMTSCGFGLKNGLTTRGDAEEAEEDFDVRSCSDDVTAQVQEFLTLRQDLTSLTPLCSESLDRLAKSQSDWLQQNPELKLTVKPHEQKEGTPGYSGADLAMRMRHLNINSSDYFIAESIGQGGVSGVWTAHLSSVLHRSIILAPGLTAFGHARSESATVLTAAIAARGSNQEPVYYPSEGAVVGSARLFSERPVHELKGAGAGFPISIHFSWECLEIVINQFDVFYDDRAISGSIYKQKQLPRLRTSEVFFIADQVLPAGKTINVSADVNCGSKSLQKSWSFKVKD